MTLNQELLERVAARVLGDVTCLLARPLGTAHPRVETWAAAGARLRFRGRWRGYMELWAPRDAASVLAADLLGQAEDDASTPDVAFDAVMEMLQVLCGNMLAALAGPDWAFSLGTPRRQERLVPFSESERGIEAWLEAGGHPLLMRLRLASPDPEIP